MGEDQNKEKGKKILMYVVLGVLIIMLSYALVYTLLGMGNEDSAFQIPRNTNSSIV